jgi:hypothetical protein
VLHQDGAQARVLALTTGDHRQDLRSRRGAARRVAASARTLGRSAVAIGLAPGALPRLPGGIYIAINGQVHASNRVRKDPALGRFVTLD